MLTQNPAVLTRLREEILGRLGTSRRPTLDDFREMKYLRAVINGVHLSSVYLPKSTNLDASRDFEALSTRVSTSLQ